MTTKHTPGPWHIANGVQIRSNRDQIAKIWMMRDGEGCENARLIAAAPELLEALRKMCAMWRSVCSSQGWEPEHLAEAVRAQAAIARATGEQP